MTYWIILIIIFAFVCFIDYILSRRKKRYIKAKYFNKEPQPKLWFYAGDKCCGNCRDFGGRKENQEPDKIGPCMESAYTVKRVNICKWFRWGVRHDS